MLDKYDGLYLPLSICALTNAYGLSAIPSSCSFQDWAIRLKPAPGTHEGRCFTVYISFQTFLINGTLVMILTCWDNIYHPSSRGRGFGKVIERQIGDLH